MRKMVMAAMLAFCFVGLVSCREAMMQAHYDVIPKLKEMHTIEGKGFVIKPSTRIVYPSASEALKRNAGFLAAYIESRLGFIPKVVADGSEKGAIVLRAGNAAENPEAYSILVDAGHILIEGVGEAGNFYGVQTLRKSLETAAGSGKRILMPAVAIADAPRFGYRGVHLDVARHYFPVSFVKTYIDILALHHVNVFHWHLSDDQGWRVEVKKYPQLAEKGQWRKETLVGHYGSDKYDGTPYGGYYTQEEVKEIVEYAADRYITVIPEIDLPGHMLAALSAYPELGCTGGPYEASRTWGVFPDILCAGKESTMKFLEDVLGELAHLFPGPYFHIGGDEAPKERWAKCPYCQAKIKALGIKGSKAHSAENQLQSYVVARLAKHLEQYGKRVIGWDEILEGGIGRVRIDGTVAGKDAIIMSWRGTEGGMVAARMGHDAIMTPYEYLYFDYYQSKDREAEPVAIGGFLPVEKVYAYEPVSRDLSDEEAAHILGCQCNLWTEYIATPEHASYMLLPRLAALSEVQWCAPDQKNYEDFLKRIPALVKIYDKQGWPYAKHLWQ